MLTGQISMSIYTIIAIIKKKTFQMVVFFSFQLLAEQAPISSYIRLTALVSTYMYENHSRKQPVPVMDTFFVSQKCPLTRTSTALEITES